MYTWVHDFLKEAPSQADLKPELEFLRSLFIYRYITTYSSKDLWRFSYKYNLSMYVFLQRYIAMQRKVTAGMYIRAPRNPWGILPCLADS